MTNERPNQRRSPGRVEMHLPGGYTRLLIEAGGLIPYEVPTERIPPHLRNLGTRVHLVFTWSDGYELTAIEDLSDELYMKLYRTAT